MANGSNPWVNPSPNIPRLSCVPTYNGTVMLEGQTCLKVGVRQFPWKYLVPLNFRQKKLNGSTIIIQVSQAEPCCGLVF